MDDSYKVQRGNCDPSCMNQDSRWTCEHNSRTELAEADDSIPFVEDVNARMRPPVYGAECLPPLPYVDENGKTTCAKPWITKGQVRNLPQSLAVSQISAKVGYSEFHDMMMQESYKLNPDLNSAQLASVGPQKTFSLYSTS